MPCKLQNGSSDGSQDFIPVPIIGYSAVVHPFFCLISITKSPVKVSDSASTTRSITDYFFYSSFRELDGWSSGGSDKAAMTNVKVKYFTTSKTFPIKYLRTRKWAGCGEMGRVYGLTCLLVIKNSQAVEYDGEEGDDAELGRDIFEAAAF
jgi:hypothetical protein